MATPAPKGYLKVLEPLTYKGRRLADVFGDFVTLSACALAPRVDERDTNGALKGTRDAEYLEVAGRYSKDELDVFARALADLVNAMEQEPFTDLLGPAYEELQASISKRGGGEFYTPHHVSVLMAELILTAESFPADRPLECSEPACGAGRLILATAQTAVKLGVSPLRMRWTATDVSKTGCDMCFVNTTLNGVPCGVIHGNTLTLETWATYPNMWWPHARGATDNERRVELFRKLLKGKLCNSQDNPEEKRNAPHPTPETADGGQIPAEPLALGKGSEQGTLF